MARGKRHLLLGNIVVPRPIALISTISADGIFNLAPYSMSGIVAYHPATVCFTASRTHGRVRLGREDGSLKDSRVNAEQTMDFVFNMVNEDIAQQMNIASGVYPPDVDEFQVSGLTPVPSDIVKPPRVKESPVSMECRVTQIIPIGESVVTADMVIGVVLRIHVRDDLWRDGIIDTSGYHVIGRMGWGLYTRTRDLLKLEPPQKVIPK